MKGVLLFYKTIHTISGNYVCKVVFSAAQFSTIAVHQTFYTFLHEKILESHEKCLLNLYKLRNTGLS